MHQELTLLAWSIALGVLHLAAAALAKRSQEPSGWAAGSRDTGLPPYSGIPARLARAQANFMETWPFFAAAVLLCHAMGHESGLSTLGAQLYLAGRIGYLPLYAFGVPYLRTAIWFVALIGLCLALAACLT